MTERSKFEKKGGLEKRAATLVIKVEKKDKYKFSLSYQNYAFINTH